jgi:hypothetical protein
MMPAKDWADAKYMRVLDKIGQLLGTSIIIVINVYSDQSLVIEHETYNSQCDRPFRQAPDTKVI